MATDTAVTIVDAIVTTVLADTPPLASTLPPEGIPKEGQQWIMIGDVD
jgi:hypothetical protein